MRLEKIPWIQERLLKNGAIFEPHGTETFALPMIERARKIECLFLDPDGLCSIHRAEGHEAIPLSCQLFPFDFLESPSGEVHVSMSRLCPSIQDSYGNNIESILPTRFQANGSRGRKLCETMDLGFQTALTYSQYTEITDHWITLLKSKKPLQEKLSWMHQMTLLIQKKLEQEKSPSDPLFQEALAEAKSLLFTPPSTPPTKGGLIGRILVALSLYRISYPVRVMRSIKFSLKESILRTQKILQLVREQGSIDLLYTSGRTSLENSKKILSAIESPMIQERLTDYFIEVICRKNIFEERRNLLEILFLFALAYTTLIRFAQIRASSQGRNSADPEDYREGIGIVEFSLLFHPLQSSKTNYEWLQLVMGITAQNELSFEKVLHLY